jgi:hypothetical protein
MVFRAEDAIFEGALFNAALKAAGRAEPMAVGEPDEQAFVATAQESLRQC